MLSGIKCPKCGKYCKDKGGFTDEHGHNFNHHSGCVGCEITFDYYSTGYIGESGDYFDASYAYNIQLQGGR